jgi:predicted CXXCH cytochrome family protein
MASSIELVLLLVSLGANPPPELGYCVDCHAKLADHRLSDPTRLLTASVHKGLEGGCVACHGGDAREPTERAHSAQHGYRGKPSPKDIPEVCGDCHSNATYMRRFSAQIGIDQLAMYHVSGHHAALEQGEMRAATCISCHGAHDIKPPSDASSPVNRKNVVKTCAKCHGDPDHPARKRSKSDPVADWTKGVHGIAMLERNETAAAICIDCHGNHGAAPPGVADIHRACGKCHADESERFERSAHKEPFGRLGLRECEECHRNHAIEAPGDFMLQLGEGNVCAKCHASSPDKLSVGTKIYATLAHAHDVAEAARAEAAQARKAGLLIPEADVAEKEMMTALRLMRAAVHDVDPSKIEHDLADVQAKAKRVNEAAAQKRAELVIARRGYIVFIALIAGMVGLLVLKIRRLSS